MPREITTTVYEFEELTDEAKEEARDWMRHIVANDPFWVGEIRDSYAAAEKVFADLDDDVSGIRLWKWINNNVDKKIWDGQGSCPLTGVCFDHCMLQPLQDFMERPDREMTVDDLRREFESNSTTVYDRELESQMEDEFIDDHIIANEYEFTANGARA